MFRLGDTSFLPFGTNFGCLIGLWLPNLMRQKLPMSLCFPPSSWFINILIATLATPRQYPRCDIGWYNEIYIGAGKALQGFYKIMRIGWNSFLLPNIVIPNLGFHQTCKCSTNAANYTFLMSNWAIFLRIIHQRLWYHHPGLGSWSLWIR